VNKKKWMNVIFFQTSFNLIQHADTFTSIHSFIEWLFLISIRIICLNNKKIAFKFKLNEDQYEIKNNEEDRANYFFLNIKSQI